MLLILDLDETLLHGSSRELAFARRPCDFQTGPYHVYLRPHLEAFLQYAQAHFELAVWTSATASYAHGILAQLFAAPTQELAFAWSRARCTRCFDHELREHYWVKDLKKVKRAGYLLSQVLAVDDTPRKYERSYGNWIPIPPYFGDSSDEHLLGLCAFLETLRSCPNVRSVEKRGWYSKDEGS